MPLIMPWDAARLETEARRADADSVARAATPYTRAGERVRGSLMSASAAANPTRGAAGSREAMIAAAPTLGSLATAGADAENAARAQATRNMYERDLARSENAAQLLGIGLNAGGAVGGMLTSGLGGMGGGAPGAAPGPAGGGSPLGGLGSLLGAAAPIAGMAVGGPAGGMAGGALGPMLSGAATTAPERATIASSLGMPAAPATAPAAPVPMMAPSPGLAPRPIAPGGLGSTPSGLPGLPGAGPMSEEEMRRLGLIGGGY